MKTPDLDRKYFPKVPNINKQLCLNKYDFWCKGVLTPKDKHSQVSLPGSFTTYFEHPHSWNREFKTWLYFVNRKENMQNILKWWGFGFLLSLKITWKYDFKTINESFAKMNAFVFSFKAMHLYSEVYILYASVHFLTIWFLVMILFYFS